MSELATEVGCIDGVALEVSVVDDTTGVVVMGGSSSSTTVCRFV